MAHTGVLLAERVEPVEVGRRITEQMANSVERAMAVRDRVGTDRILDVHYLDLVGDTVGTMARIHEFLELDWDPAARERISRWQAGNPQNKYGRHRYCLADFGLEAEVLDERFKAYRERFGVAREPREG